MENKIKSTLFRFVSLRNPELIKDEEKEKKFIFRQKGTTLDYFSKAVSGKEDGVTNQEVLRVASTNYQSEHSTQIYTEEILKSEYGELYGFSVWLIRNRSTITSDELRNKILELTDVLLLDAKKLNRIWDNLYYQVISEKSFYTKEILFQILLANHVLKHFSEGESRNIQLDFDVIFARVVLPVDVFTYEINNKGNNKTFDQEVVNSTLKRFHSNIANRNLKRLKKLKEELIVAQEKYDKEYQTAYKDQKKLYDNNLKPTLEKYYKDLHDAEQIKEGVKPYIAYPDIPEFSVNFRPEISELELSKQLSKESYDILVSIKPINKINSFQEYKDLIQKEEETLNSQISQNTDIARKIAVIDGIAIPLANRAKPIGNNCYRISLHSAVDNYTTHYGEYFIDIQTEERDARILNVQYQLKLAKDNVIINDTQFSANGTTNNTQSSYKLFPNKLIEIDDIDEYPGGVYNNELSGTINFVDGKQASFSGIVYTTSPYGQFDPRILDIKCDDNSFTPENYGYRQIGIADYNKVEQTLQCYVEGEVSHIENIMASEYKERSTRRLKRTEDTTTFSSETESEQLTDTSSTSRFEMQSEIGSVIQKMQDFSANTFVNGSYNGITFGASANFATNTSTENSTRQAVTEAKEITERALDRVVARIKEERISKIIEEYEENNKHGYDNTGKIINGDTTTFVPVQHISGVYRWVDKLYKNQIVNYGKRLMFEFMVPNPGQLFESGMKSDIQENQENIFEIPDDPRTTLYQEEKLSDYRKCTEDSPLLMYWISRYNVKTEPLPQWEKHVGKSFSFTTPETGGSGDWDEVAAGNEDFKLPEGYYTLRAKATMKYANESGYGGYMIVGGIEVGSGATVNLPAFMDIIPVSFSALGHHSGSVGIDIHCRLSDEYTKKWQRETFNAIITAYEEKLKEYNEWLEEQRNVVEEKASFNPLFYREIERTILRKNCISYIIDRTPLALYSYGNSMDNGQDSFSGYEIELTENLDKYSSFVKFIEQAFEWEIISYHLYPYYWAKKSIWKDKFQFMDLADPIFTNFMRSGMARVIVSVRPGFEDAVQYYLTTGNIWNGGEVPVIGDSLYLSIVDELREIKSTPVGKPWITRLPTALTILQANTIGLQVDQALPCDCEGKEDFENPEEIPCDSNFNIPGVKREIEITYQAMDRGSEDTDSWTIGYMDDGGYFPRRYNCMGESIIINRDAAWVKGQSTKIVYELLAERLSQINGITATQVDNNQTGAPDGIKLIIDVDIIPHFRFIKNMLNESHSDMKIYELDTLEISYTSGGVKIISGVVNDYHRVLDKNGMPVLSEEMGVILNSKRFRI